MRLKQCNILKHSRLKANLTSKQSKSRLNPCVRIACIDRLIRPGRKTEGKGKLRLREVKSYISPGLSHC